MNLSVHTIPFIFIAFIFTSPTISASTPSPDELPAKMLRAKPTKLEVTRSDIEELDFFRKKLAEAKDSEEARLEREAAEAKKKSGRRCVSKKDDISSR